MSWSSRSRSAVCRICYPSCSLKRPPSGRIRRRMSSNPFATRFIRPGAIPFLFLDGDSAEAIIERLKANHWRGQIVGEHGSGKSTLVATLIPLLEQAGRNIVLIKIGPGERRLPEIGKSSLLPTTDLIVDGYEQLS